MLHEVVSLCGEVVIEAWRRRTGDRSNELIQVVLPAGADFTDCGRVDAVHDEAQLGSFPDAGQIEREVSGTGDPNLVGLIILVGRPGPAHSLTIIMAGHCIGPCRSGPRPDSGTGVPCPWLCSAQVDLADLTTAGDHGARGDIGRVTPNCKAIGREKVCGHSRVRRAVGHHPAQ